MVALLLKVKIIFINVNSKKLNIIYLQFKP